MPSIVRLDNVRADHTQTDWRAHVDAMSVSQKWSDLAALGKIETTSGNGTLTLDRTMLSLVDISQPQRFFTYHIPGLVSVCTHQQNNAENTACDLLTWVHHTLPFFRENASKQPYAHDITEGLPNDIKEHQTFSSIIRAWAHEHADVIITKDAFSSLKSALITASNVTFPMASRAPLLVAREDHDDCVHKLFDLAAGTPWCVVYEEERIRQDNCLQGVPARRFDPITRHWKTVTPL